MFTRKQHPENFWIVREPSNLRDYYAKRCYHYRTPVPKVVKAVLTSLLRLGLARTKARTNARAG